MIAFAIFFMAAIVAIGTSNIANAIRESNSAADNKVVIESDNKSIEIIVSVETHKTTEDG